MVGKAPKMTVRAAKKRTAAKNVELHKAVPKLKPGKDAKPKLLSGGNPQIAKGYGDAPVYVIYTASRRWSSRESRPGFEVRHVTRDDRRRHDRDHNVKGLYDLLHKPGIPSRTVISEILAQQSITALTIHGLDLRDPAKSNMTEDSAVCIKIDHADRTPRV